LTFQVFFEKKTVRFFSSGICSTPGGRRTPAGIGLFDGDLTIELPVD
jgi:hypothetical protein